MTDTTNQTRFAVLLSDAQGMRSISIHDTAEDAAEAMGNIAEGYALAIGARTYGAVTTGKLTVGRDGGQVVADFAVVASF